jgi:tetratricopeptide (TPR) repeat protein
MKAALFACLLAMPVFAQEDFAALVKKGDAADAALKTQEALAAFLAAEKLQPNDASLLVKIAKQYGESQTDSPDKNMRREVGNKALEYSKRAVALAPKSGEAHLALAVSYGRVAPYLDNKTKIAYSKLVKEQVDQAIELDPKNDLAWHVLGAWNYELANLNSILRAIAKLIYGDIPKATNEDAAKAFRKAIELNPKRVANWVELGRTLIETGNKTEAKAALEKGLSLPNKMRDDPEVKDRARVALKKV